MQSKSRRREFLKAASVIGITGLTGCEARGIRTPTASVKANGKDSSCTVKQSVRGVDPVPVTVDGHLESAEAVLDLRWNARVQNTAKDSPDDVFYYEADEDSKFIVFSLNVTNNTSKKYPLGSANFGEIRYETPDIINEVSPPITGLSEPMGESEGRIKPGGSLTGTMLYSVPAETTLATLRPTEPGWDDMVSLGFNPSCDRSLEFEVYPVN